MSISESDSHHYVNEDNLKQLIISKRPFPMTTDVESGIINELAFLFNKKIFLTYSCIEEIYDICDNKTLELIGKFLLQFSLNFSNNYPRLLRHRNDLIKTVSAELAKIEICQITKRKLPNKKVHVSENDGKKLVRFDMINAVSAVIGIKDWSAFMSKYTDIELYQKSKALRGKIMANIHSQCMNLVNNKIYMLSQKIGNYVAINSDEIVVEYDSLIDYNKFHKEIDPNGEYRMTIFTLEKLSNCYLEHYEDGTSKQKCLQQIPS